MPTTDMHSADLGTLVDLRRLIVCVGTGGVGKTTTAAAIGIEAARRGKNVLVITIDPARRLANALGLSTIGSQESEISAELFDKVGVELKGKLVAMMLDTRSTFDDIMGRISPDEQTRERILNNNIYKQIAGTISTAQEYIAGEKLHDVYVGGEYDLIVLDTPPMKNALDFLESSNRMVRFLDDKIIKWFVKPMKTDGGFLAKRLMASTGAVAYRLLGYVFGAEFLKELNDFFFNFKEMTQNLRTRSEKVGEILRSPTTAFLIVCSPRWSSVEDARHFSSELQKRRLPDAGLIVNQVRSYGIEPISREYVLSQDERTYLEALDADISTFVPKLEANYRWLFHRSVQDQRAVGELKSLSGGGRIFQTVPRMLSEINDIPGLVLLNKFLFAATKGR